MNIFVEFLENLERYGLEYYKKYYGIYRGTCYDNQDPEFRGRIRILCETTYGNDSPEEWALPKGVPSGKNFGLFAIPSIGDNVWIQFEGGNARFPVWDYGHWESGQTPKVSQRKKPNNYVFQTPLEQRIEFDDENKLIRIKNKKGYLVTITEKGILIGDNDMNMRKFFDSLFQLFAQTTTTTQLGAMPFVNAADYALLKEKLALFLIDSDS